MDLKTKRLSKDKDYQRPQKTHQDMLSNQEIKDQLKDYKKVSDITKISIGTHLRYYSIDQKTGEKKFRLGGTLNKFGDNGQYIILSNGKTTWSAQIASSIFFQKMSESELKEELKKELKKEIKKEMTENDNDDLEKEHDNLKKKYKDLEKEFKNLAKQNETLISQIKHIENEIKKDKKEKKDKKK